MFKYEKPFMEVVEFEDEVIICSPTPNSKQTTDIPSFAAGEMKEENPFVGESKTIVGETVNQ